MSFAARWEGLAPELKSVLRIVLGFLFMQHGLMKFTGWPMPMPPGVDVSLMSQTGIGGIIEGVGGFLLLIGLFTRPVAFVASGEMAVAYFQFHFPNGVWPMVNQGETAVLYCFVWLYFSAAGAGPWSVDAAMKKP